MKYFKRLTRSITMILAVVIVVGTPMLMGRILGWCGVVAWLDGLWTPTWLGLAIVVISRAILAAGWVAGDYFLIDRGQKGGWFWFKPGRPTRYREDEPEVDMSGTIVTWVAVVFVVTFLFELFFRVGAWSNPPYLPPQGG